MLRPDWIDAPELIPDPLGHGERAVRFLRKLRHPKSQLPGKPFQLDPWQEAIIRRIYGPRHEDGSRVVRRAVIVVPRGNRKTSLAAAITLASSGCEAPTIPDGRFGWFPRGCLAG